MRTILLLIGWLLSWTAYSQALRDVNFNYLYNTTAPFRITTKPVRHATGWEVFFAFQVMDSTVTRDRYTLRWEWRQSLSAKEGVVIIDSVDQSTWRQKGPSLTGKLSLSKRFSTGVLAASVLDKEAKRLTWFYTILTDTYPVTNYLVGATNEVEVNAYVHSNRSFKIEGNSERLMISYFNDDFPPAAPAFSEAMARVSSAIKTDSLFTIQQGESVTFSKQGLYLIQQDTSASEGTAFRVQEDYPKYSKLENLPFPLVYITTKQEYEKLMLARGNKKAFDKVILTITKDGERARTFMRNYFRRVEMANQSFSSYKEGWKTDRGMIYIIFGIPDEVYKSENRETWKYDNSQFKLSFNFVRSGTLFDPDNYVLVREVKYQKTWYEVIDLWRNVRF